MAPEDSNIESSPGEQPAPEAPPPVQTVVVGSADAAPVEAPPSSAPPPAEAAPAAEAAPSPKTAQAVPAPASPKEVAEAAPVEPAATKSAPTAILVIDIGGTKVKILATGQTEPRKAPTGKDFTPARLVETVRELAEGWQYEAISIGYPGLVGFHGPRSEPGNLGPGWVGFDFAAAFDMPVKMVNDAAMQALGSYEGGRMLFLGLGTGLGSTLITGKVVVPLELGQLLYDDKHTLGEVLGRKGLDRLGKSEWRRALAKAVSSLMGAF